MARRVKSLMHGSGKFRNRNHRDHRSKKNRKKKNKIKHPKVEKQEKRIEKEILQEEFQKLDL